MKTITIRAEAIAHNGCTHTNDVLRASLGSEHTEDASSTADIKDGLALEQIGVVQNGIAVSTGADRVLQHLLVDT